MRLRYIVGSICIFLIACVPLFFTLRVLFEGGGAYRELVGVQNWIYCFGILELGAVILLLCTVILKIVIEVFKQGSADYEEICVQAGVVDDQDSNNG